MDERVAALAEQLLLIERELRVLGFWSDEPPSAEALASVQPFCVDTMSFETWLQWLFLPRMKMLLEADAPLPTASGIREMADMRFRGREGEVRGLLRELEAFDVLIKGAV